MPIFDLFSKRQKHKRGEAPDVFQYEKLSSEFRVQVVHILRDALGKPESYDNTFPKAFGLGKPRSYDNTVQEAFRVIHDVLCREYGVFLLTDDAQVDDYVSAVYNFFLRCEDIEQSLDVIELSFKTVGTLGRDYGYRQRAKPNLEPDDAISELNLRFLEHGIGYQFESGEIIRIDSKLVHAEIIKPALQVLSDKSYAGASDEFLKAHEHYRHGRHKECLNECLKSFESVMKVICKKRHWVCSEADTAKRLLEVCFQNGLIPSYLQSHFSSLRTSLESGVPTIRNKLAGHGQGTQQTDVPRYLAAYMLNLTATSILLLTDAEKALP